MAINHERARQVLELLKKKIKFSPIVSIQGPRQCGKSYFAREIISNKIPGGEYYSLDRKDTRDFAALNPRSFLEQGDSNYLIIDEVQKAPDLFHEMKDIVDRKRKPGQFIILGSTEFSIETQIKESLTGRLSRIRLFPFNLSESLKLSMNIESIVPFVQSKQRIERKDLLRFLKNGGLPGIFGVKSDLERQELLSDWIKLTVSRDLAQIRQHKLDSDIAYKIIEAIAKLDEPSAINIANELNINSKRVQTYLNSLELLFVIISVSPFQGSAGKKLYYLTDTSLVSFFESTFEKKLITWFYLEMSSQLSYKGFRRSLLHYYQPPRGTKIHLVFEDESRLTGVKIIASEKFDKRDYLVFNSFRKKYESKKSIKCISLSGGLEKFKHDNVSIFPWESVV